MKTGYARYRFRGGVHPHDHKDATAMLPIRRLPIPDRLTVSMSQHLGKPAAPVVKPGDRVLAGQCIGQADGLISATVHSPAAGVVKALEFAPTPAGRMAQAVIIDVECPDAVSNATVGPPIADWAQAPIRTLITRVGDAGVAGMGGAGFPTRVKLSPPPDKPIDTLILNGAECEPYLTSDHRLMLEQAGTIAAGARMLRYMLGNPRLVVAIEDNTPDAASAMRQAFEQEAGAVEIVMLETRYPQGSEKQQIFAVTGREVPAGGLPMDIGVVVENVATAAAVCAAISQGKPLTERVVTVTGQGIREPANVLAPIGASLADLVAFCGGLSDDCRKLVIGGPMMGLAQPGLEVAITKTTSGILGLTASQVAQFEPRACINCARCNLACPLRLMPSELARAIEADDLDEAESLQVMDCFECGCCAYSCPARRPMVQHMRRAKSAILLRRNQERART